MEFTRAIKFGESLTAQQEQEGKEAPVRAFAENLVKHIPGEASGFYLLYHPLLTSPSVRDLYILFGLSLALLLVVRLLAKASWAMIVTTVFAFLIWMAVIDQGVFRVAYPNLLGDPWGVIVAGFYSTLIGILGAAGKIR